MAAIRAGQYSNSGYVEPLAARLDMAAATWDPSRASATTLPFSTYVSGTLYLTKLLYPFDRVSALLRYFGATGWSGQTSLGWVLYSTDGTGADITTLTKVATIDITSSSNGAGSLRHTFTTVAGLTPGHAVYVGWLQVGATAGTMRQDAGGGLSGSSAGANVGWADGQAQNWATATGATGLANLAATPSTIAASAFIGASISGPPFYGLRP